MERGHTYFPIFIEMEGKKCILYGGGVIATRRAAGLLKFGARVVVYAPRIGEEILSLQKEFPGTLQIKKEAYKPGIPQADFVFSCTDDLATDREIYLECRQRKIPVNIASDQKLCDFLFPALAEREELVVGISSGGKNHQKVRTV